jgi:GNAT superfamily N-acetyltransferase
MRRRVDIRGLQPEDESLIFGLARLDRGADERTLDVLDRDTVFVAEVAGDAAGYVACVREGRAVRVDQLWINPEHEAEGVGTKLLEYVEGFAISEGAWTLQVVVESDNDRARRFYQSRGFVSAGDDVVELVLPRR